MECKGDTAIIVAAFSTVLIETLWNVKTRTEPKVNGMPGINRNIVECKDIRKQSGICLDDVLIETLWNVKLHLTVIQFAMVLVLIETLWNVKAVTQTGTDTRSMY